MTKKDMLAVLDNEMLETLKMAIYASDNSNYRMAERYMVQAIEVMHVASRFGLLTMEQFANINRTLNFSDIPYEPI